MLLEHHDEHPLQPRAICSIAAKIGCTGETLRSWLHQAERDQGIRAGLTTSHDLHCLKTSTFTYLSSEVVIFIGGPSYHVVIWVHFRCLSRISFQC